VFCFVPFQDSSDIVDCKLKLILGLIWTLILHYSISLPIWEGEEEGEQVAGKGPTPKQRYFQTGIVESCCYRCILLCALINAPS
jgi:hypothetical protein